MPHPGAHDNRIAGAPGTTGARRGPASPVVTPAVACHNAPVVQSRPAATPEIESVLDRLLEDSGADATELFVKEPGGTRLWLSAHRGIAARDFLQRTAFEVGEGFPGMVAETGESVLTVNLNDDRRFLRTRLKRRGFRCFLCVPVLTDGHVVGSLHIASRRPQRTFAEHAPTVAAAAAALAGIIELAQLRAKDTVATLPLDPALDAKRNLERRLHASLERMVDVTEADGGIILLRDPASGSLHPWSWTGAYESACAAVSDSSHSCACSVITERRALVAPERADDPPRACRIAPSQFTRVVCLPLVSDGSVLGAVSLGYRGRHAMPGRLMTVLGAMAQRLALEVANAQASVHAEERAIATRDLRLKGELDELVERSLRPAMLHLGRNGTGQAGGTPVELADIEALLRSSAHEIATVQGTTRGDGAAHVEAPGSGTALDVRCLGSLTVFRNGQRLGAAHVTRRRAWKLLGILIAEYGRTVEDEVLLEYLWPEGPPPGAAKQLKVLVHDLRHTLAPGPAATGAHRFVVRSGHGYAFDTASPHRIDSRDFASRVDWGERLAQLGDADSALVAYRAAADLYAGDFLAEERYSDWCAGERAYLRERLLTLLRHTATLLLARGDGDGAIACLRRALHVDEGLEGVHVELMRVLWGAGRGDDALRQYRSCRDALKAESGRAPQPETVRLAEQISAAIGG